MWLAVVTWILAKDFELTVPERRQSCVPAKGVGSLLPLIPVIIVQGFPASSQCWGLACVLFAHECHGCFSEDSPRALAPPQRLTTPEQPHVPNTPAGRPTWVEEKHTSKNPSRISA